MKLVPSRLQIILVLIVVLVACPMARAGGERKSWKPDEARTYLDEIAGAPKDSVKIVKGLDWLKSNQSATGAWRGVSVNKKRDPASHSGKPMSDAATAFAVLALSH